MEEDSVSPFTDIEPGTLGVQLLCSFERSGDLNDLRQAILALEVLVKSGIISVLCGTRKSRSGVNISTSLPLS